MDDIFIRVSCPECRASFKARRIDIPDTGATAVCKKCGSRFTVFKSDAGSVPMHVPARQYAAGPQAENLYSCPRCGHRQIQPFNCYACGAVITPKETPSHSVPAPSPSAKDAALDPNMLLKQEMGVIVVRTRTMSHRWLQVFTRPRIHIDGMDHLREWGVHTFEVPKGDCTVAVDYVFLLKSFGRNSTDVRVSNTEKVFLDYSVKTAFASSAGSLVKASLAEGILWQPKSGTGRRDGKTNASKKGVILSLLLLGPLGLVPLWKSDQFSGNVKWAITAAMALITIMILSKL